MMLRNPTASPRNVPSSSNDFYTRYSTTAHRLSQRLWTYAAASLPAASPHVAMPLPRSSRPLRSYFFNLTAWQHTSSFYFLNIAACWKVSCRCCSYFPPTVADKVVASTLFATLQRMDPRSPTVPPEDERKRLQR